MEKNPRELFNESFSDQLYQDYLQELTRLVGHPPDFRLAETPVFIPAALLGQMIDAGDALIRQASDPALIARLDRVIPDRFQTPGRESIPSMVTVDFAVVERAGVLEPKLIELQGFPSLYAFEVFQRDAWVSALRTIDGLDREWSCWPGLDRDGYLEIAEKALLGNHSADDVVLVDLDPDTQKTRCDFSATKRLFGIETFDARDLRRRGRELWVLKDGVEKRVHRLYNRVITDELVARGEALSVDFNEELDVEWVCHPDWFYIWSKATLPYLDHPCVPEVRLVSELGSVPDDLTEGWVLKPLFSFAGGGVQIDPQPAHLEQIPDGQEHLWCLQRKVEYAGAVRAIDGGSIKAEVRLMYLRPDPSGPLVLAENLVRLSRGKMLGVDHNKDFTWVGSTVGLFEE